MSFVVAPFGTKEQALLSTEVLTAFSQAPFNIRVKRSSPNYPDTDLLLASLPANSIYTSPTFATGAVLVVDAAGGADVFYEFGSNATVKQGLMLNGTQQSPIAVNATATLTPAQILTGIITSTTAAAVTGTLPTAALLESSSSWVTNEFIDWVVINTGASNAFTIAVGTGHTIVGAAGVAASTSGRFRTRRISATSYETYRV